MAELNAGKLIVLSGPSGVGKTTLLRDLLARFSDRLRLSVSATTRPARAGEEEGVDYYFLTPEEFERQRARGEFLESCEVFGRGYWYGTPRSEVTPSLATGNSVLLEIDVDGAAAVVEQFPEAVTVFVCPSSLHELERRLRQRGTESEEAVRRRLEVARRELERAGGYRYQVVNDTVDDAVEQLSEILSREIGTSETR